jgi:hypothetical protein
VRRSGAAALALAGAIGLAGCQSTHDRAAKLAALGSKDVIAAKLAITANAAVRTHVLALLDMPDGSGTAVVVELRLDDPKRSLVWAPIDVRLYSAAGALVAQANVEGAAPELVHVPSLAGGNTVLYVNDLLSPTDRPVRAEVVLGGTLMTLPAQPGTLRATVRPTSDPTYGPGFAGTVTNTTGVTQQAILVQVVARRGGRVVAAGTATVGKLDPGESADYQGLFIGDPAGAVLSASAPASNVAGQGAPPQ